MKNKKFKDNNTRIQLSLSATMFFAPMVKHMLSKGHLDITKDEENFINGYIRLGYISIGFLIMTIVSSITNYLFPTLVTQRISIISVSILLIILTIGTILVLSDTYILQGDNNLFSHQEIKSDKGEILLSFIPLYNVYQRYKLHNFEHPYRWTKESLLRRTLFVLTIIVTKNTMASSFVLTLIIIRVASLLSNIDILEPAIKAKINKLFYTNTEEIWAYISGSSLFLYNKLFLKTKTSIIDYINQEKDYFKHLFKLDKEHIIIQYMVAIILFVVRINIGTPGLNSWIHISVFVLIFGKYSLMAYQIKHLPAIPVANEITQLLFYLSDKVIDLYNKHIKK